MEILDARSYHGPTARTMQDAGKTPLRSSRPAYDASIRSSSIIGVVIGYHECLLSAKIVQHDPFDHIKIPSSLRQTHILVTSIMGVRIANQFLRLATRPSNPILAARSFATTAPKEVNNRIYPPYESFPTLHNPTPDYN